jgi:hypothetical protein
MRSREVAVDGATTGEPDRLCVPEGAVEKPDTGERGEPEHAARQRAER